MSLLVFMPSSGRAAAQNVTTDTGALPGGGTYIVRRDTTAPTVAIELWYRAPAAGYDESTPGISRLAITAIAASAAPHGTSLAELVTRVGGSLAINVYPDIAMVGVSVPSWQSAPLIRALTNAYFSPTLSDDGYKAAVRDSAVAAAEAHFDSDRILQDSLFAHIFSAGPAHYPPVPSSAQDFAKIPAAAVRAFAGRAFRRGNVFMTLTGNIYTKWIADVAGAAASQNAADPPFDSTVSTANVDVTQTSQVPGIGFAWIGPPIADPKAATAMDFIADYLFDGDHGIVAAAIRKKQQDAFVTGQFITLHNPGVLLVTVSGSTADALRTAITDAVTAAGQPLPVDKFNAARSAFVYHILTQTQTPSSRADNYGWYAAEGNAPYAPGDEMSEYFKAAQSLDPGYVADVVRKYLQHPAIVQLLTSPRGTTT